MRVAHGEVKRRVLRARVRLRVRCDAFAGFQLGAPSKAYFRNFAEAMHATHSKVRILVRARALRCVSSPNACVPQQSQTLSLTHALTAPLSLQQDGVRVINM